MHENRHQDAKKHAKQALETSQRYHSPNHCYLLSKLKYVESALARREGNYEKAREYLDDSVEVREIAYMKFSTFHNITVILLWQPTDQHKENKI